MTKKNKTIDPFREREAIKYDNPIPSREYILAQLKKAGKPLPFDRIASVLKLSDETELEALSRRLKAMCRDGQILQSRRDRYGLVDRMHLIAGEVMGHRDGHGFVIPEEGDEYLFLMPKDMRQVLHGDKVLVRPESHTIRGKRVARLVEVTSHKRHLIAGRYFKHDNVATVEAENQRFNQSILISDANTKEAKQGQVVLVEVTTPPDRHTPPLGEIVEVLGDYLAPGMETEIAIRSYELPHVFPAEVLHAAKALPENAEIEPGYEDLRHLPFVTIDGADAKDFDDAVYCEKGPRGTFTLYVAIADVSRYVKPGDPLDKEALLRGNSVYFPQKVVPMLPEKLSNGLCSLKPNVDRLALVCEMKIKKSGQMGTFKFYSAIIHSHARLTYDTVADILQYQKEAARKRHQAILTHLEDLYALYHILHPYRMSQGSLYFNIPSPHFVFDDARKIQKLVPSLRNDAHCLIEECMLCANVAAAKFIVKAKMPGIFRVHPGPETEKIKTLRLFLKSLNLKLGGGAQPDPQDYVKLISKIEGRDDELTIYMQLLRSLMQAYYSTECDLHFGLAFKAYTHFTSPIRRYPDLLVHRIIKAINQKQRKAPYETETLARIARATSITERRAEEATRDVISWLKCEYMANKVGETFSANISNVCGFGLFVELRDIFVEGLVHVSALANDYYTFDEKRLCLTGEHSKKVYALGDTVMVRLVRVSLEDRQIDFEMAQAKALREKAPPRRRRRSKKPNANKDVSK